MANKSMSTTSLQKQSSFSRISRTKKPLSYEEWASALAQVPVSEQAGWIYESLRSKKRLHIFGRYFFPHWIEGSDEVPECHINLIDELTYPGDGAVIFPRGFSKSTWEKIDTIHDVVYSLEPVILLIGATRDDAAMQLEGVKGELESNEDLILVYGNKVPAENVVGRKWTSRRIQTVDGVNVVTRGRAKGRGVNINGKRPTKVVIDDAEDDDQVKNPDLRRKFHDWLYNVIFPSLDKERGRVKMIGTVLHEQAEVLAFYKKHGGIFRRAIEDGKSIWPNRYTLSDLFAIRDGGTLSNGREVKGIGTRAFNREYMNTATGADEAHIKPEWIEKGYFANIDPQFAYEAIIYLDPQAGESAQADEFAVTVLYNAKGAAHRYVFEQVAGRIRQLDQAKEVVRAWLRHKRIVRVAGVEKVLNQTAVYQILLDWKARKINFNTETTLPHELIDETDRNLPLIAHSPNGKDKVARLQVFEGDFERGEIHLRREQEELAHQLMFTLGNDKEHDDRADSLVGALELAGRNTKPKETSLSSDNKKRYNETIAGNLMNKTW